MLTYQRKGSKSVVKKCQHITDDERKEMEKLVFRINTSGQSWKSFLEKQQIIKTVNSHNYFVAVTSGKHTDTYVLRVTNSTSYSIPKTYYFFQIYNM